MRTIDACRDWLAADEGWTYHPPDEHHRWYWSKTLKNGLCVMLDAYEHPIEESLDAAAAAMPEGWTWLKNERYWIAVPPTDGPCLMQLSTGDELADRFNLAVLVREKIKENNLGK